jgi:EmrB/QacA subfamily drug resistance transporter
VNNRWKAFAVIAIAVFISILDLFIVNIAFPDIQRDFSGSSLSDLSWVLSAYAIVFAALLVPAGKLGDLIGRKRVFTIGLLAFVAGSALCAAAPSLELLIAARVLQAVGGAAITPTSLGLVLPLFPPEKRSGAIGAWAAIGGVGAAMGPPLGGLLVEASWRWIFLVNVPLGLISAFLAQRRLQEIRDSQARRLPDALGTLLLVASIALLTLGLVRGSTWDWDGRVIGSFAAALVLAVLFTVRAARHPAPVLELPLLRVPIFAFASVAALLFFAAFGALLLSNVLFLTSVWHYSVLKAGFALSVGPMVAAIFAGLSGRLAGRFGAAMIGAPGGLLFALGAGWLIWQLDVTPDYAGTYLPSQVVIGMGIGLILPSFTSAAVTTLAPQRLATGIGAQTTFRQIGAALGVAGWVAILGTPSPSSVLDAFDDGFVFMALLAAAAGLTMALVAGLARRQAARHKATVADATGPGATIEATTND